jgi:hypothetical protein
MDSSQLNYEYWCAQSDDELALRDIAEVNLFAAYNLPFAGKLDFASLLGQLDLWAEHVDDVTRRAIARNSPDYRELPFGEFRILAMVSVLQQTLRVRYNLGFMEGEYDATDSRNLFIHGILQGHGGTCVSMPVLYAAIGRRLGYPIKLVLTKQHAFCRWNEPGGERFNFDATSRGFAARQDEYYLSWPEPLTREDIEREKYLQDLTPREELAFFLGQRGHCLSDNLDGWDAAEAYRAAYKLTNHQQYMIHWAKAAVLHRALEQLSLQTTTTPWATDLRMPEPNAEWEK